VAILSGAQPFDADLTSRSVAVKSILPRKTERGRQVGLMPLFPSFEIKGKNWPPDSACPTQPLGQPRRHNLGTYRFWSIRPNDKSTPNWNCTPVGNGR